MSGNVPAIRFAGFTEPWEQRKFGDTFAFLGNNTLSRAELSLTEGTCLDIHYGDVLIKYGEVLDAGGERIPHIADDQKAIAHEMLVNIIADLILIQVFAFNQKLRVISIIDFLVEVGLHLCCHVFSFPARQSRLVRGYVP